MHKFFYSNKDSWISDISSSQNFGGDEVLELHKAFSGDNLDGVTRILVQFNLNETGNSLSQSIADGIIPRDAQYFLRMYSTQTSELPDSYRIMAFPLAQSWVEGTGKLNSNPALQDGVTWTKGDHSHTQLSWSLGTSGKFTSGSSSDKIDVIGGGVWYTGSGMQMDQAFSYESPDINMDVTTAVSKWISGSTSPAWDNDVKLISLDNYGMIIKYSGSYESSSFNRGDLKFFSSNTHTIYSPKLEVKWNDCDSIAGQTFTGSLSALDTTGETNNFIYVKNLREEYRESEIVKFRIGSRPKYVGRTFTSSPQTHSGSYVTTGSLFYSIKDIVTDETLIPFGQYSSCSLDVNGNYFKQDLNTFQPNRVYKIILKMNYSDGQEHVIDDDYIFKVVR